MTEVNPEAIEVERIVAAAGPKPLAAARQPVDPIRSAAGRLGGRRVHELAVLGREYEKEHGLAPGRERLKHLIKLGKRYEVEHGLRAAKPLKRKQGDAWQDFVAALARVIKPAHRAALEQLAAALSHNGVTDPPPVVPSAASAG
ncbi:unnamed protein product [Gemmataceae bacterium]|nr:unnamed protein product [Gemmataceae bacterium]VTT99028.1 unnamed protein product [Gemmataceae bacterium]